MRNINRIVIVSVLMIGVFLMGSMTAFGLTAAGSDDISVVLNGQKLMFDQQPVGIDGRTMVPVRGIFEAYGAHVSWDQESLTITASTDDTEISMTVGKNTAYVNGRKSLLDVPPLVINGRTLVPVRFVSEALNADVEWDDDTRTVQITSAQNNALTVTPASETSYSEPEQVYDDEIQRFAGFFTSQEGISGGCYLASLSMVASNLNGKQIYATTTYRLNGSKAYVTWDLFQKLNMNRLAQYDMRGKTVAEKTGHLLELLSVHPEGVIAKFINGSGRTHYIVVRGYADGKFLVNDPVGQVYVPLDECWTGYSMFPNYESAMSGMVLTETYEVYSATFDWSFLR